MKDKHGLKIMIQYAQLFLAFIFNFSFIFLCSIHPNERETFPNQSSGWYTLVGSSSRDRSGDNFCDSKLISTMGVLEIFYEAMLMFW